MTPREKVSFVARHKKTWKATFSFEDTEVEKAVHLMEKRFFDNLLQAKTVEFIGEHGRKFKFELKSAKRVDDYYEVTVGRSIK